MPGWPSRASDARAAAESRQHRGHPYAARDLYEDAAAGRAARDLTVAAGFPRRSPGRPCRPTGARGRDRPRLRHRLKGRRIRRSGHSLAAPLPPPAQPLGSDNPDHRQPMARISAPERLARDLDYLWFLRWPGRVGHRCRRTAQPETALGLGGAEAAGGPGPDPADRPRPRPFRPDCGGRADAGRGAGGPRRHPAAGRPDGAGRGPGHRPCHHRPGQPCGQPAVRCHFGRLSPRPPRRHPDAGGDGKPRRIGHRCRPPRQPGPSPDVGAAAGG